VDLNTAAGERDHFFDFLVWHAYRFPVAWHQFCGGGRGLC